MVVKIIPLKSNNYALVLRKRLFCNARPTLLPCKRGSFGAENTILQRWFLELTTKNMKFLFGNYLFCVYICTNENKMEDNKE